MSAGTPRGNQPQPRFAPTRWSTLLLVVLIFGVGAHRLIDTWYSTLPPLPWGPLVSVGLVALIEVAAAWRVAPHVPGRKVALEPVEPLLVARLAVLAKASSVLGAAVTGVCIGAAAWLVPRSERVVAAEHDVPVALAGIVVGVLLVVAALWLEWACRIPSTKSTIKPPIGRTGGVSDSDTG